MQIFEFLLPLKYPLVTTLSETCKITSRKNVAEKGMTIPNLSETIRLLWLYSSVSALEKKPLKHSDALECFYVLRNRNL